MTGSTRRVAERLGDAHAFAPLIVEHLLSDDHRRRPPDRGPVPRTHPLNHLPADDRLRAGPRLLLRPAAVRSSPRSQRRGALRPVRAPPLRALHSARGRSRRRGTRLSRLHDRRSQQAHHCALQARGTHHPPRSSATFLVGSSRCQAPASSAQGGRRRPTPVSAAPRYTS